MNEGQLSRGTGIAMILSAVLVDFVFEPFLSSFANIGATFVYWNWLQSYDIKLFGGDYSMGSLATVGLGFIPIINLIIPEWTLRITTIVRNEWRRNGAV